MVPRPWGLEVSRARTAGCPCGVGQANGNGPWRAAAGSGHTGRVALRREDLVRLRRGRDRIDRDHAQPLDVAVLAHQALMSPGHFSRCFKAAFGETPYDYLMTRRVERAKALLRRGDVSVTEACFAVGCSSLGSFSARFTRLVGETPSAYRSRDHSAAALIPSCVLARAARPSRSVRIGEATGARARLPSSAC